MSDFFRLFLGTIVLRPYVFAFLACYVAAGCRHIGWKRTLAFIPLGYALAWLSEFSSIHWGFPYGDYHYIPSTAGRELWVFGVPFMDSLSYVFLSYCSYSVSLFILCPLTTSSGKLTVLENQRVRRSWETLFLGAFLFMLLDIVIDPVALLGERWFLGKIYGYRHPGFYFGIPISNFGGWFLVGAMMVGALQFLDRIGEPDGSGGCNRDAPSGVRLLGPLLYFCVLLFNIAVTFRIGENLLGLVDLVLLSSLLVLVAFFTIYKTRHTTPEYAAAFLKTVPSSRSMSIDSNSPRDSVEAVARSGEESG
jgi:putative membrane protein